ncbi:MAG: MAPEG family protein [Candidatus Porifericomitaceae bacterium WSBS_2022_MAG_OTU9]
MQPIDPILYPVLAMVLLTTLVSFIMAVARVRVFKSTTEPMENLSDRYSMAPHLTGLARRSSDNFNNLLEQPTIFYVLCLTIAVCNISDTVYLWLAWAYVAFRIVHTLIHCGYNNMPHRGMAFMTAGMFLLIMFAMVAVDILPW